MPNPGSTLWRCLFLLCWTVGLIGIFAPQNAVSPVSRLGPDVVLHALALAAMTATARLALPRRRVRRRWFWPLLSLIAINLEVLQHLVQPSRFFSLYDLAANLVGVALAALGFALIARKSVT